MNHHFALLSGSFRRSALPLPRHANVNTTPANARTPAQPLQCQRGSSASSSSASLPTLSPRPRPAQTPIRRLNAAPPPPTPICLPSTPRPVIKEMIFCASIQERPEWAPVIPVLQAGRAEPRWEKTQLGSHDLAVRIVTADKNAAAESTDATIRFLLVAPGDVGQPDQTKRLQCLAQRKSGFGGVVIFLLSRGDGEGHNMAAYRQLQLDLRDTDLSILPLTAVATLPATLAALCGQIAMPRLIEDNPRGILQDLVRIYFGDLVPLSIEWGKQLVDATEAAVNKPDITLQDVILFCSNLRDRSPYQLTDLLGAEDASCLADF